MMVLGKTTTTTEHTSTHSYGAVLLVYVENMDKCLASRPKGVKSSVKTR